MTANDDYGGSEPDPAATTEVAEAEDWLKDVARAPRVSVGAAVPAPGSELLGGRFVLKRQLGQGGMGVVFQARDRERNSTVALKLLSRVDAPGIYRLKNEFRSLADVLHPNLVALHELFSDDGRWFFTMEQVKGVPFDDWVRDGDESRLQAAMSQLVEAVSAIHAAGMLHRDLKPNNVLVDPDGRVVVLDFGLAMDPEPGSVGQTVADGSVSGTPAYMSPEQAAGADATAASDFYAVGIMLYEALTGELPFDGSVFKILAVKQRRDAPSVSDTKPQAPHDLAKLCDALLCRDPDARPDAAALRKQLGSPLTRAAVASSMPVSEPAGELLVGREQELRALHDAYAASRDGDKPVIVLLSGPSGMGKSALDSATRPWSWLGAASSARACPSRASTTSSTS